MISPHPAWRWVSVVSAVSGLALLGAPVLAGPAPTAAEDDEAPSVDVERDAEKTAGLVTAPEAEASRERLEASMADLGSLAREAKSSGDMVKTACVEDRRTRAQGVMELATQETLIIRDPSTDAQARQFAQEKLGAAADRMEDMVAEARNCGQDTSPEVEDDRTRTQLDAPETIPLKDPTGGLGENPVPPAVTTSWPFVASPTE